MTFLLEQREEPVFAMYRDQLAFIVLNRPQSHNRMSPEILDGFDLVCREVAAKTDVRCVILTGQGPSFCAGADFAHGLQRSDAPDSAERSLAMYRPFLRVLDLPMPVIAALNGHAVGGGFGLSLMADIRIANRDAKMGANFCRLGVSPGMAISYFLPRIVGMSRAYEMMFTGRLITGAQAQDWGLVSSAVAQEVVLDTALALAHEISDSAPLAVRLTKQMTKQSLVRELEQHLRTEADGQAVTLATSDAAVGIAAAKQKVKPVFSGT